MCLAAYPVVVGATRGAAGSRSGGRHVSAGGLGSLPVAAQGPVSRALGAESPEYRVRSGRSGLSAGSGVHGLRMGFGRSGVVVGLGSSRLTLRLAAVGYGDRLHSLGEVTPRSRGNSVSYVRAGVDEWYANGPLGLEQGFTLRPLAGGSGLLTLSLELGGDLRPVLDRGGRSLTLDGADGRPVLAYGGLLATDARGHRLPASLSLGDDRLQIGIGAVGAAFPIRVDPFIQQAELTAGDGAADDYLGYSVAVSGDGSTVVAGAYNRTVDENSAQGAVYVFSDSGGSWAQSAELTASDGAAYAYLGHSVAVSGDGSTVVAGAYNHKVGTNGGQWAVYVFSDSGGSWAQSAELTASDGAAGDGLGWSVGLSGDGSTIVAALPSARSMTTAPRGRCMCSLTRVGAGPRGLS